MEFLTACEYEKDRSIRNNREKFETRIVLLSVATKFVISGWIDPKFKLLYAFMRNIILSAAKLAAHCILRVHVHARMC